jgi:hypothetical protein
MSMYTQRYDLRRCPTVTQSKMKMNMNRLPLTVMVINLDVS